MNLENERINHAFEKLTFQNDSAHMYYAEHKLK